jgi:peptidoglycan/LPS O-acetylase OafA/YrhL
MAQKSVKSTIAQPVRSTESKATQTIPPAQFVFGKSNYRIFLIAIAVVILGFVLMSGTTDIYDFRKIVLAPLTVLAGFAIGFFAIFKKTDKKA